jgi:hypothetical protein
VADSKIDESGSDSCSNYGGKITNHFFFNFLFQQHVFVCHNFLFAVSYLKHSLKIHDFLIVFNIKRSCLFVSRIKLSESNSPQFAYFFVFGLLEYANNSITFYIFFIKNSY